MQLIKDNLKFLPLTFNSIEVRFHDKLKSGLSIKIKSDGDRIILTKSFYKPLNMLLDFGNEK